MEVHAPQELIEMKKKNDRVIRTFIGFNDLNAVFVFVLVPTYFV